MISELTRLIDEVGKNKGINREILIEALESAMLTAAKKKFGPYQDIEASFNEELGEVELFEFKTVVNKVKDPRVEISFEEAVEMDPGVELGDSLGAKMDVGTFGRISAQTAKQVIIQKVRDAERENVYNDYKDRKGELVNGIIHRIDRNNIIVNLGRAEAILPPHEQVPKEMYNQGDRIKAYILDILKSSKGTQIILSRTHPGLLIRLFEVEVPEISEEIVKIKGAVREPGSRAKIAVYSEDLDVDPVGASVGMKGSRVRSVVQELHGEKIDIVPWSDDPAKFVCNALSPAEISEVIIDDLGKTIEVIVADDQLSLAIGKKGQNVRLAARLTGWKIDIKSESKVAGIAEDAHKSLVDIPGIGDSTAVALFKEGFFSAFDISSATIGELTKIEGIGDKKAERLKKAAEEYLKQKDLEKSKENSKKDISLANGDKVEANS
ncbi:MAG: transcription termination factor NusA [Pseudomonadota bacterium]